jgi:hypothetical protein
MAADSASARALQRGTPLAPLPSHRPAASGDGPMRGRRRRGFAGPVMEMPGCRLLSPPTDPERPRMDQKNGETGQPEQDRAMENYAIQDRGQRTAPDQRGPRDARVCRRRTRARYPTTPPSPIPGTREAPPPSPSHRPVATACGSMRGKRREGRPPSAEPERGCSLLPGGSMSRSAEPARTSPTAAPPRCPHPRHSVSRYATRSATSSADSGASPLTFSGP